MKSLIASGIMAASLAVVVMASSPTSVSSNSAASPAVTAPTSRQTGLGAAGLTGLLGAVGSMIPSAMGNMLPLVLLFGLGALMVPALGLGLLLREGRRQDQPIYYYRSFPSFNINTSALVEGFTDVLDKVVKALDNVDRKYK